MSPGPPSTIDNSPTSLLDTPSQQHAIFIERLRARFKTIIIAIFAGSMTLDIFNVTGLVFAQKSIATHFNGNEAYASWTLSVYSFTFGSFLLLAGRAGISSSLIALIILRAFQGMAAAATIPTAYALVANSFQGEALEMAVAGLGACQSIGVIAGVVCDLSIQSLFSSRLTLPRSGRGTSIGYRGLLWLSFGLGVLLAFLGFILILPTPSRLKDMKSLDYGGAVIVTTAALLLVLGFTESQAGWHMASVIAPIVVGGAVFVLFGLYEEMVLPRWMPNVEPLIPRRVWGYKNLVPILGSTASFYGTFCILILNGSQFYVDMQNRSTIISTVQFLPIATGAILLMPTVGHFYNHRFMPPKWVIAFGQCLCLAGVALSSRNSIDSSYWCWSFPGLVLFPFGACTFFVNFLNIAYASTPPEEQGLISGIVQMAAQIATALAFGIASSFVTGGTREELLELYRRNFYLAIAFAGLAVLTAAVFIRPISPKPKKTLDEEKGDGREQTTQDR